jgi:RNA polymerase sigma-70 factor (ECF subfamily)
VAAIRAELDEADRVMLLLRVDQEMSWNEIAEVLSEPEGSPEERARAAARLRKRFQLVKQAIYERAREQGLIEKLQTRED